MKIKKGTLVLLLKQGLFGSKTSPKAPLRRRFGLVEGTDFGKGFRVKSFSGSSFVLKKEQIVPLVQVEPRSRKLGIRAILKLYHRSIILRFSKGVLRLNKLDL